MRQALTGDFSNATDLADDLVLKGLSFREAHEIVGKMVRDCIEQKKSLEALSLGELRKFHSLFDEKSLAKLTFDAVVDNRTSHGGTSATSMFVQLQSARDLLAQTRTASRKL